MAIFTRLTALLRTPLYRNGYALVFSSVATSGLGILYWILAARLYPVEVVGLNAAVMSAIMFVSNLAQFNLVNGLNRFLPAAGNHSRRLILGAYLVNTILAVVAGGIFLLGVNLFTPSLSFVNSNIWFASLFVLSVIAYGIFALQDSVFIGIRKAIWVPVENLGFSILKMALLVPFAFLIPAYGILASWLAPLVVALVIVNILLFRRMIPEHSRASQNGEPPSARTIGHYVIFDYIGTLFWLAGAQLLPVIVTQLAGATTNAYFYLAWQISYALTLIARNMGSSLVAEVASRPEKLHDYSWRALIGTARIIIPAVVVILIFAPYILELFGHEYAQAGTTLLRLLALSSVPGMVVSLYMSMARIQKRMQVLILVQAANSMIGLALVFLLLDPLGLPGIGLAWLISQTVVALVVLATGLRTLFLSHLSMRWPLIVLDFGRKHLWRMLWTWKDKQQIEMINQSLPKINQEVLARFGEALPENWGARKLIHTVSDVNVFTLGEDRRQPQALLKLATSNAAIDSLQRQMRMLSLLRNDSRLESFNALLPNYMGEGDLDGSFFVVERMIPGVDARSVVIKKDHRQRLLTSAAETISLLHRSTASTVRIDERMLRRWVDDRLELVRRVNTDKSPLEHLEQRIERLTSELRASLYGKTVAVSWIHGDYFPGNILSTPDGATILGIVDWDLAGEDHPMIDHLHLLLSTRILMTRRELGDIVRGLLEGSDHWTAAEMQLLETAQAGLPGEALDLRALLLLTWLRHITSNLTKTTRFATQWLWVTKNISAVLGNL